MQIETYTHNNSHYFDCEWISWQRYWDAMAERKATEVDWVEDFGFTEEDALEMGIQNTESLIQALRAIYCSELYTIDTEKDSMDTIAITDNASREPLVYITYGFVNTYPVYQVIYCNVIGDPLYLDLTTMSIEEAAQEVFSEHQHCTMKPKPGVR